MPIIVDGGIYRNVRGDLVKAVYENVNKKYSFRMDFIDESGASTYWDENGRCCLGFTSFSWQETISSSVMKKVIKKEDSDVVTSSEVSVSKFYGVLYPNNLKRVITYTIDLGFFVLHLNSLTFGAGEFHGKHTHLSKYIDYLISDRCQVFEFETLKDLVEWVEQ